MRLVRVLIVDGSALLRSALSKRLSADPGIEVIGVAPDAYVARDKIVRMQPNVLLLGVELPGMDGVEFLERLMPQYPLPVVVMGSPSPSGKQMMLRALEAGAVDLVSRPSPNAPKDIEAVLLELRTKLKIAFAANVSHWKSRDQKPRALPVVADSGPPTRTRGRAIAIGASTGGTEAIRSILRQFPVTVPGVVIVQHMPPGFTSMFARRLNTDCVIDVKEAEDGDAVLPGRALIAPGARHMRVVRNGHAYQTEISDDGLVCGHRPSVEVLMLSVAHAAGRDAVGVMLTGMGRDGAVGMKAMREAGARTLAQDEETSVVFGMPKAAHEAGGAECLVPLDRVPEVIVQYLKEMAI